MIRARAAALPAAALAAVVLAACSDSTGPASSRSVNVSFSTSPKAAAATASRGASYDVVVGPGSTDSLVIDTAQVVLRRIELASATGACAATGADTVGCPEIRVGPAVVSLPLTAGVGSSMTAVVPAGSYSRVELELHKVGSDSTDAAFAAAHPELAGASVRVTGSYHGQRFVFTSAVNESLELAFAQPVVVDSTAAYLTVAVDVASWFRGTNGATLAPTAANAGAIGDRIRASFRAFRDGNRDGRQD